MIDSMALLGVGGAIMAKAFTIVNEIDHAFNIYADFMVTLGIRDGDRDGLDDEIMREINSRNPELLQSEASICDLSD